MAIMADYMTKQHIDDLSAAFEVIDTNKTGYITIQEI
jgi:Ca2+-binding EF-hand superfamily protein